MAGPCAWCGARAARGTGGDVEWVVTLHQLGCEEHELLEPPDQT